MCGLKESETMPKGGCQRCGKIVALPCSVAPLEERSIKFNEKLTRGVKVCKSNTLRLE